MAGQASLRDPSMGIFAYSKAAVDRPARAAARVGRRMGEDRFGALRAALAAHGQEQLLRFWDELGDAGRARLERDSARSTSTCSTAWWRRSCGRADVPVDVEGVEPAQPAPRPRPRASPRARRRCAAARSGS